jgi:hypothetical protein
MAVLVWDWLGQAAVVRGLVLGTATWVFINT